MLNILEMSRNHPAVSLGVSPRGGTFLQRTAQAWAAYSGRSFVEPGDVKEVAVPVLSHRIILRPGGQITQIEVVQEILDTVPVPI